MLEPCQLFCISLAFLVDVLYNAITIKIFRLKAEPFHILLDGHIVRVSIVGFHTIERNGSDQFQKEGREWEMEIERVNDNTVKFFLSYIDIEERGFTKEEVWYNRDKSEELFWEMMDEVNDESEFEVEGPLWIQVHAMSGGIEVTVTRAQLSADGEPLDSPFEGEDPRKMFPQANQMFENVEEDEVELTGESLVWTDSMFVFNEFDALIPLAGRMSGYDVSTSLYSYNDNYYLFVKYTSETMEDNEKTDIYSVLSEFGVPSNMTIHRLLEYGTIVMSEDVFTQVEHYFGS